MQFCYSICNSFFSFIKKIVSSQLFIAQSVKAMDKIYTIHWGLPKTGTYHCQITSISKFGFMYQESRGRVHIMLSENCTPPISPNFHITQSLLIMRQCVCVLALFGGLGYLQVETQREQEQIYNHQRDKELMFDTCILYFTTILIFSFYLVAIPDNVKKNTHTS